MSASAAAVLSALRRAPGGTCSGEALSTELGVSRAAIWKQIQALRRRGYEIDGARGDGYTLRASPDRLYPEEIEARLETRWLARDLVYLDSTESTNRDGFELATRGAPHGATVVAERQTAGRGRLGRAFFSPAYRNLYTSIVLRPEMTIAEAPTLILSSAIAVAETAVETIRDTRAAAGAAGPGPDVEIKWPNDVLVGGRKTSGILMETSTEGTRITFAILGIGVNLNVEESEFPDEFRAQATSLRAHLGAPDARVDRVAFAANLYGKLEAVLDVHAKGGFAALRERFDARFRMPGREVEVGRLYGAPLHGVARGIAPDGALEVEMRDGRIERVVAGDVTLSPRPSSPGAGGART